MKNYRVAILGCRSRGTAAARAYHAHPRTEVVGLCDLIQERTDTLGNELGVSARFTDLDEMIVETRPDIVAIPTGTEFHYELSMRVLEYGVNIDVEKPMCIDLEQADAVMAKAKKKGARVAVHHQGRVGAFMQAVGKAFAEGRIGKLRYIYGSGKGYYGGYGLMNIGTHMLNNMLKFVRSSSPEGGRLSIYCDESRFDCGKCRSVTATALTNGRLIMPEDVVPAPNGMGTIAGEHITATLQFDNNVTANLLQHRFSKMDSTAYSMELYGTEGRLVWKSSSAWLLPQPHYLPDGKHDSWKPLEPVFPEHYSPNSSASQDDYWFVEEYVQALDEDRDHDCSGTSAHHVLEIMMGIFESAAYRKRVDLPQEKREHPLVRWRREHGLDAPAPMPRPYGEWLKAEDQRIARR